MLNKRFRERLHMLWAKRKKENEMVVFQPPVEIYSMQQLSRIKNFDDNFDLFYMLTIKKH